MTTIGITTTVPIEVLMVVGGKKGEGTSTKGGE
jgi:hypothetical protein